MVALCTVSYNMRYYTFNMTTFKLLTSKIQEYFKYASYQRLIGMTSAIGWKR